MEEARDIHYLVIFDLAKVFGEERKEYVTNSSMTKHDINVAFDDFMRKNWMYISGRVILSEITEEQYQARLKKGTAKLEKIV